MIIQKALMYMSALLLAATYPPRRFTDRYAIMMRSELDQPGPFHPSISSIYWLTKKVQSMMLIELQKSRSKPHELRKELYTVI